MTPETFLIVEQLPAPPAQFAELLSLHARDHGLDAYICRQRLLGPAQALLAKGQADSMRAACITLRDYAI